MIAPKLTRHTCYTLACSDCGDDPWEEFTPHFPTEEALWAAVLGQDGYGWTRRADGRALCRSCSDRVDCAELGHQMTSQSPLPRDPDIQWRHCQHPSRGRPQQYAHPDRADARVYDAISRVLGARYEGLIARGVRCGGALEDRLTALGGHRHHPCDANRRRHTPPAPDRREPTKEHQHVTTNPTPAPASTSDEQVRIAALPHVRRRPARRAIRATWMHGSKRPTRSCRPRSPTPGRHRSSRAWVTGLRAARWCTSASA